MKHIEPLLVVAILFTVLGCSDSTDRSDADDQLLKELNELTKSVKQIQKDLRVIKLQLATAKRAGNAQPVVIDVELNVAAGQSRGNAEAALTLIEFTDYQCPFCAKFKRESFDKLTREYIDTGKIRYVVMDLPLERIHPLAFKAAEAAHCAGEQDKFWDMHDRLFEHQKNLRPWKDHAVAIGLDTARFDACLEADTYVPTVRQSLAQASKINVTGTPSFVIAATGKNDPNVVRDLRIIRGARPFDSFKAVIDSMSATAGS